MSTLNVLGEPLRVINIGLEGFAEDLQRAGVDVIHVDWHPPTGGNTELLALLASLDDED